ncbi:MAG: GatB/YqeY domain-containing protein [Patescibacteria group bacterium]|nr:GatB/YqeY domain-containing protein [Patescibacteria group bacterium]
MSLLEKVQKDLVASLKARNSVKSDVLRLLVAALKNAGISKPSGEEMSESDEVKVIFAESKKLKDSVEQYSKAGRDDLSKREKEQLGYVMEYLPEQMSEKEIEKLVDKAISKIGAESMRDIGKVMGIVMGEVSGKADGVVVSKIVKKKLS